MNALTYPFIVVAGVLQALGNAMNARLRKQIVNPWLTATVSFVPVVACFLLIYLALPLPASIHAARTHWYDAFGGIAGAVAVLGGLLVVDEVGSGAFNGIIIVGNIVASLAIDAAGLFGEHRKGFEAMPWIGGALMGLGVYAISRGGGGAGARERGGARGRFLYPLIFVAGCLQALGAVLNAQLRSDLGNPWLASLVSFVAVAAVFAVLFVLWPTPLPSADALEGVRWWMPLAGVAGAVAVFAGLLLIDRVGAGTFNGLSITANLIASLVLDHFGWLGMPKRSFGISRAAGCALMIAGVVLVSRSGP